LFNLRPSSALDFYNFLNLPKWHFLKIENKTQKPAFKQNPKKKVFWLETWWVHFQQCALCENLLSARRKLLSFFLINCKVQWKPVNTAIFTLFSYSSNCSGQFFSAPTIGEMFIYWSYVQLNKWFELNFVVCSSPGSQMRWPGGGNKGGSRRPK